MNITQHPSPNFGERPSGRVDMLLLHYTGMASGAEAIARLCDESAQVSAHYVVEEDGHVLQLVDEYKRAWHAGVGSWQGHTDINSISIGIEIVNGGHDFLGPDGSLKPFPPAQIQVVMELVASIKARWGIAADRVIGHSDIAPTRKTDPGEHFPWATLAANGLCAPIPTGCNDTEDADHAALVQGLAAYGYDVADEAAAITAFQRHFRPTHMSGRADSGTLRALTNLQT